MKPWALGFVLALSCSLGCARDHYSVIVSPADAPRIAEALAEWETFTDATFDVNPPGGCAMSHCITVEFVTDDIVFERSDFNPVAIAVTNRQMTGIYISIQKDLAPLQETVAAIHEFGHALGLQHPCKSGDTCYAVMNPVNLNGAWHVACMDVEQYYKIRGEGAYWTHCQDPRLKADGLLKLVDLDGGKIF